MQRKKIMKILLNEYKEKIDELSNDNKQIIFLLKFLILIK